MPVIAARRFYISQKNLPFPTGNERFLEQGTGVDLHFRPGMGENRGSHQFLNWWQQQSPGLLHLEWFDSLPLQKNNSPPVGVLLFLEQGTGVEPASEAWEATIIADILTLRGMYYSRPEWKKQPLFVDRANSISKLGFAALCKSAQPCRITVSLRGGKADVAISCYYSPNGTAETDLVPGDCHGLTASQ